MIYRPRHFALHELVYPELLEARGDAAWEQLDAESLAGLDALRDCFGRIIVNNYYWGGPYRESGLRSFDTSTGARYSMHRFGRGFDLKPQESTPREMFDYIVEHPDAFPFTTLEDVEVTKTWLHVDRRNNAAPGVRIVRP